MRFILKSRKGVISVLLIVCLVISMIACASVVNAAESERLPGTAAGNYYLWGLNTNDPDFGAMSAPTGSFSYDGTKGYYYYDLNSASGDYCFVVSTVNNSGATAVRSPAVGGVAQAGKYYLSQGNYRGYACMHLWNPSGDAIRIYFTSESSGLNAIAQSEVGGETPTVKPTTPVTPTSPTSPQPTSGGGDGYIYCRNDAGWDAVYAYLWNTDSDKAAKWPGEKMTNIGNNVWRYALKGNYANIIFNIGSDQKQTDDLVNAGAGKIYNNKTGAWSDYDGTTPQNPTSPTTPVTPTSPVVVPTSATQPVTPGGSKVIFCEDAAGWGSVYVYMWNGAGDDKNATWPGATMTKIGNNIWRYVVPKDYSKIIFNIGGSQTQTTDMNFPGYGYIYNNKTNEWSIYDTSPLQVQSFSTDLTSPQFAGVGITMTASATGEGTVKYKFSATNSSGVTKLVADYSTRNSAVWTPDAVGTYTLVYEFKDTKGNTNKRTLTYKVEDGSASVSPFIKQVSPISGQQIKKATACKVTVSAGGGNTGTKLLFYKFTVKDSAGKTVNVPYYTTSSTYTFTPSALGTYTVTVNVQGSDNDTIERVYAYESVNTIVTPTEPADPPTEPTVRPTEAASATKLGDADSDGKVTVLDATRIQRFLASLVGEAMVDKANADTDHDGKITILDATRIQRFLAGLISSL